MSTSASLTRLMLWPNSLTSSSAVSWSIVWVMRDRRAHLEQRLDQVGAALGHAVGELLDGDRLGHDDVADLLGGGAGLLVGALFLLARAAERGELRARLSSSPVSARVTVSLPRMAALVARPRPGRAGLGGAWARARGRRGRRSSRSSSACSATGSAARAAAASSAARALGLGGLLDGLRRGVFLGLAIVLGAALLVLGLRLLALRSSRRRASSSEVMRASSASRSRRSCISLRVGDVVDRALGAGFGRGRGRLRRAARARGDRFGLRARPRGASPGLPRMRRFLTSTTTVFERPWLKLCFTLPVSTVRLRPSGGRVPSFGLSVWSVIHIPSSTISSAAPPSAPRRESPPL